MKHFILKRALIAVMLLLTAIVNAGNDVQTQNNPFWSGGAAVIAVGATVEITGNRYSSSVGASIAGRNYYTERAYGIIKLSSPTLYQSTATGSATVKVTIQ